MDDFYNALLRIEGADSPPGEGWYQVPNAENFWVWELPESYPDLKQSVFEVLSSLDSASFRVVLHLALSNEVHTRTILIDSELVAFLGSKGAEIELFAW